MRPKTPRHPSPDHANTMSELALKMGVPLMRVKRLINDGLCREPDGAFSVEAARLLAAERSSRGPDPNGDGRMGLYWRRRLARAQAKKQEMEYLQARGQLIRLADARREWSGVVMQVKNEFLRLGKDLAPVLVDRRPTEVAMIVDKRVRQILNRLAHPKYCPEVPTASEEAGAQPKL